MKGEKGQLAIFIILALVVIGGALVFFVIRNQQGTEITSGKSDSTIYSYTEDCIETAILDSVETLGLQQGYYSVPGSKSLDTGFSRIAYYYFNGDVLVPNSNFIGGELSKIINDKISGQCNDFSIFEEENFIVESLDSSSKTSISENEIMVDVDYPVSIRDENSSDRFSDFSYKLPIRLGHIIDVSENLVNRIKENQSELDLTYLLNQDVDISIDDYDECNKIYILIDNISIVNDEPYAFTFAVKLDEQYCAK